MCIYLQWDQNVHHLYLPPFIYSLGACSVQFSCLACIYGLHTDFLLKITQTPESKADGRGRLHATSCIGEMSAWSSRHCCMLLCSTRNSRSIHTHMTPASPFLHSSPDTAFFSLAQPCLKQTGVTVHSDWNKGERTQRSTLFVLLLCKYFNSSDGYIWKVRTL